MLIVIDRPIHSSWGFQEWRIWYQSRCILFCSNSTRGKYGSIFNPWPTIFMKLLLCHRSVYPCSKWTLFFIKLLLKSIILNVDIPSYHYLIWFILKKMRIAWHDQSVDLLGFISDFLRCCIVDDRRLPTIFCQAW